MSPAIKVENLGKKYIISHQQREQYTSLRDVITNGVASFGRKIAAPFSRSNITHPLALDPNKEDFWALKDVSFEVKQGDRVGIIGRNGAGKSTLLKILSRITEPTTGSIRIKGRVASLLEVGTGFHPELTGRENIYLNGAILGMGRAEIKKKFDEIVDFAEIEKFLDTPVKRYSSGMYVRLAFAVAAHLEPEILIVDEVLAVGDAQFQKKCLGKMEEVGKEGRTVLFVSHNIAAIQALCTSCITLHEGAIIKSGLPAECIESYMGTSNIFNSDTCNKYFSLDSFRSYICKCFVTNSNRAVIDTVQSGDDVSLNVVCQLSDANSNYHVAIDAYNSDGDRIFYCNSSIMSLTPIENISGMVTFRCKISHLPLMPDTYILHVSLSQDNNRVDLIQNAFKFFVVEGDFWKTGRFVTGLNPPLFLVEHKWEADPIPSLPL